MLKNLRLQLTLMYPLVGLALVVLFGGGVYLLIRQYLMIEYYPDIELEARMAQVFSQQGAPLPKELQNAQPTWQRRQGEDGTDDALVSLLYLDASGQVIRTAGEDWLAPFATGIQGAQRRGHDLRTAHLLDDTQARILTYRLPAGQGSAAYVQIGKRLTSEDLLVNQLSLLLLGLGVFVAVLIAFFSWWLAGRSLLPAQHAWEHQQQFIANASHELRTPITLIRANAEVGLRPSTHEPRRLELLADIVQECDHVSRLVEDLLLLSRLDAGKLALVKEAIPADDLLSEIQQQFSSLAEQRQVCLVKEDCAGTLLGDRTHLRQVLMILVDNALKFTPPGGSVRLSAKPTSDRLSAKLTGGRLSAQPAGDRLGAQPAGSRVLLTVADSGVGIAPEHLPHVFERFYQAESRPVEGEAGNGLGLSIAQAIVRAQGGSIQISSQVGQGTCVTLRLPAG